MEKWKVVCLVVLMFMIGCAPAAPTPVLSPTTTLPIETILPSTTALPPTSTAPPTETSEPTSTPVTQVRFAVIGDYGLAGEKEAQVAQLVRSWNVDFIITTGDNNYPLGEAATIDANIGQYFHDYIYPYQGTYGAGAETNRFFPALGNHDWMTEGAQPYFDYFTLPGNERYYNFRWAFVHLFCLDGNYEEPDGIGRSSVQAAWLQAALAASDAPWKIVYLHMPPYSSGYHGSDAAVQWQYREWGATAVIAGHDHHYERLLVDGLLYFVNGLGGGPIYPLNDPLPVSQARYNGGYGAMLVTATLEIITFQFFSVQGDKVDEVTLLR